MMNILTIFILFKLDKTQTEMANEPMDLTTMPAALLSHILLAQAVRQKQVVAGHRGRWAEKYHFPTTFPFE